MSVEREVFVFWGRTGTGKSQRAWNEAGVQAYSKDPRSKWFCGYRGQVHVVMDEFRGAIDISHLLRWTDRYPLSVETKGSSRPFLGSKIWITSNLDPRSWYPDLDSDTLDALLRRLNITHFIYFFTYNGSCKKHWKRNFKRYKKSFATRSVPYAYGAIGAAAGASLGYIRDNYAGIIPGGASGAGFGYKYGKSLRLKKSDFKRRLSSSTRRLSSNIRPNIRRPVTGSRPGTGWTGSNPGHRFESNPSGGQRKTQPVHRKTSVRRMARKVDMGHINKPAKKRYYKF